MTLSILFLNTSEIFANDFAGNETYYNNFCSGPDANANAGNKQLCSDYNQYLRDKAQQSTSDIDKYKGEMAKYQDDLEKQVELAEEYQSMIEDYGVEIAELEANIARLEENIASIQADIDAREEEISEKDRIIIERMKKTQEDMRFGYEIDFLFKATDLSVLMSSMSVVSEILDFEAEQIEEINGLIEEQRVDQEALVVQQETIEINLVSIETSKAEAEVLKAEVDIAVANYQALMAELESLQAQAYADVSAIQGQIAANVEAMKDLEEIPSSGGFVRPISGGSLSASVWSYPAPWNAVHLGNDYAAGVGTPIYAAANGIVIARGDGCPTIGYLGNGCSGGALWGGGNQVHILVTVNGELYGLSYSHMEVGSPIAVGTIVTGGTVIGRVGSSGNSTGPHTHVEVYYLGTQSITDYVNSWNGNLGHGIGFSLANRCIDGVGAPCRMDPNAVF